MVPLVLFSANNRLVRIGNCLNEWTPVKCLVHWDLKLLLSSVVFFSYLVKPFSFVLMKLDQVPTIIIELIVPLLLR